MPWKIEHVCSPTDSPRPYAIMRGRRSNIDLTRIMCPNPTCREEFYIMGHEMFSEAESVDPTASGHLPPGFVIARSRRS